MNIGIFLLLVWTALLCHSLTCVEAASLSLALRYLQKFGYIDHDPQGGLAAQVHREDFIVAVRRFQLFSGLPVTGRVDATTYRRMRQPRCGNPDPVHRDPRSRAFILQGSKWDRLDLTFKIGQYSRTLSRKAVDGIIGKAFSYWSKPSGLTFTQVESGAADIVILFARGEHGDLSPFDGPQGVLAHAFFPDFGGDTHFDDSERWTQSARNGVNLLQVAVHELGHALGLDHSDVAAAVMAPFYDGFNPKFELHDDDIAGIRRLYPLREGTTGATESSDNIDLDETSVLSTTTTPLTTPSTSSRPYPTRPPFRPRFTTTRSTTVSSTHQSSTAIPTTMAATSTVSPIISHRQPTTPLYYPANEPPEGMDYDASSAAKDPSSPVGDLSNNDVTSAWKIIPHTTLSSTATFFPSSTTVAINAAEESRKSATESTTLQAAPATPATTNQTAIYPDLCDPTFVIDAVTTCDGIGYLFSGDYYWTISAMGEVLLPGRRISADWGGLPSHLDAALTPSWAGGRTYFFKGSWYWRMTGRKIDSGYPKLIRASWGGVPDDIDAAFQWGKNSRTYFVKGSEIWSFDRTKIPSVRGPKPLPVDRGFPQQIDAAFRSANGRTYLFSKNKYYAMSTWSFLISRYYPQPTAPRWFGCGSLSEQPTDHMTVDPASHRENELLQDSHRNSPTALHLSLFPMP